MNKSLLYFAEDATTADSGAIMPADSFLSMELASASSVVLKFKAATNAAGHASVTIPFSGQFKDACRAIAGALNSNTMTVVADEANGVYLSYNGGTFSGAVTVDNVV
tara:strand:- start:2018 stop:2338 length:321 start_codon:yes stop_codon:yes gene_type:complete